ncbi:MAG: hypothetical protein K0S74_1748 [Chlamydiales bacterium]|jgi:hypothetical protein|nr:hypothetical protein [Chlamydiales bacterium]
MPKHYGVDVDTGITAKGEIKHHLLIMPSKMDDGTQMINFKPEHYGTDKIKDTVIHLGHFLRNWRQKKQDGHKFDGKGELFVHKERVPKDIGDAMKALKKIKIPLSLQGKSLPKPHDIASALIFLREYDSVSKASNSSDRVEYDNAVHQLKNKCQKFFNDNLRKNWNPNNMEENYEQVRLRVGNEVIVKITDISLDRIGIGTHRQN